MFCDDHIISKSVHLESEAHHTAVVYLRVNHGGWSADHKILLQVHCTYYINHLALWNRKILSVTHVGWCTAHQYFTLMHIIQVFGVRLHYLGVMNCDDALSGRNKNTTSLDCCSYRLPRRIGSGKWFFQPPYFIFQGTDSCSLQKQTHLWSVDSVFNTTSHSQLAKWRP